MLKFYAYQGCSTCKKAKKWMESKGIAFEEIAIREVPPSHKELEWMFIAKGEIKALFNVSGLDYRQMGLKDKLPSMSESEALALLGSNGNLVKRPFVVDTDKGIALNGFKEEEWERTWGSGKV